MNKSQEHRSLFKERMTILLVCFFCILISGSEYIIEDIQADVSQEQQGTQDGGADEEESFYSATVDAVVPFVFTAGNQVFHLIYEIIGFEEIHFTTGDICTKQLNQFFEILLERIISTNAP